MSELLSQALTQKNPSQVFFDQKICFFKFTDVFFSGIAGLTPLASYSFATGQKSN